MGALEMGLIQNVNTIIGSPNDAASINSTLFAGQEKLFITPKWVTPGAYVTEGNINVTLASGIGWTGGEEATVYTVPVGSVLLLNSVIIIGSNSTDIGARVVISGATDTIVYSYNNDGGIFTVPGATNVSLALNPPVYISGGQMLKAQLRAGGVSVGTVSYGGFLVSI